MRKCVFALAFLSLTACQKSPDQSAEIAALKSQVADLSGQLASVRQQSAIASPPPAKPVAELEITDGAKAFSRQYVGFEECQAALRAALAENVRRKDQMDAYNSAQTEKIRQGEGGFTQSDFVHINAYCLPLK